MRNIVICCDGTGCEYGHNRTNLVETYALVEKDREQVVWYDPGVGTGGWEYEEDKGGLRAMGDQMTGWGLQRNVEDAYRRLMQCHESGDRVYLFGFSRGAFTARSLAGMLHKCGLLGPGHENLVEYASRIYNRIRVGLQSTPCEPSCCRFVPGGGGQRTARTSRRSRCSSMARRMSRSMSSA